MSSPPFVDFGAAGGATVAARSPLERQPDAERQPSAAATGDAGGDNVVELSPLSLRRSGAREGMAAGQPARVHPRGVALAVRLVDAAAAAAAGALAYRLQPGLGWPPDPTAAFTALAIMTMLVRSPDAEPRLLHDALRRRLPRRLADAAVRAVLPFALALVVVLALVPAGRALRTPLAHWLALWAFAAVAGACLVRLCLAGAIAYWRGRGRLRQAVAIFGTGDLAERLLARLQAASDDAIELVGVFDDRDRQRISSPGLRSLAVGTSDDLIALSRHRDIDRVLVALPHAAERRVVEVLHKLRRMPVEISLAPDLIGYNIPCHDGDELGGLPLVEVYGRPLTFGQILLKSAFDKTLALLAMTLGAPVILALVLAVKLDSRGPVLFRQNRYGFGDRIIGVYKFRTMRADNADYDGAVQCRPNDPRITRVGHFLRRWSLDELPQLINVLRGEMSLVGPRPHAVAMRVEERRNHDIVPDYALRHHMKPGITGWAQVNGYHGPVASEAALHARVRYDLDYINNWSPWFDLQILLRTVRIVLGQRHAY